MFKEFFIHLQSKQEARTWQTLTAQEVEWHGERGMGWNRFRPKMDALLRTEPPPQWLCVLLGSNDLGKKPLHELISCAKMKLMYVTSACAATKIIWSDILPRIEYRGAVSNKEMEVARIHYNRKMRAFVKGLNSKCIKHPGIRWNNPKIYRKDGVHMNDLGNDVLNDGFQNALGHFRSQASENEFPQAGK